MSDPGSIKNTFWSRMFYNRKWLINHSNTWRNLAIDCINSLKEANETNARLLARVARGEEIIIKLTKELHEVKR